MSLITTRLWSQLPITSIIRWQAARLQEHLDGEMFRPWRAVTLPAGGWLHAAWLDSYRSLLF